MIQSYAGCECADICFEAAKICLERDISFALTFLPGSSKPLFAASESLPQRVSSLSDCKDGFILNTFASEIKSPLLIKNELAPERIISSNGMCASGVAPYVTTWEGSTDKNEYIKRVSALISLLSETGGKTVISRVVCGSAVNIDWIDVAKKLFQQFDDAYRFLYYTPQTGAWLGATPETLLAYNGFAGRVDTMSLAGTRKYSICQEPWDYKNIKEHEYVTDYILSCLRSYGLSPEVGDSENLRYGAIEHLCHRISVSGVLPESVFGILGRLSPTPALAGYPLDDALLQIAEVEDYPRICYGGYIGNEVRGNLYCYVNLRCAHIRNERYCLFAGGGITAHSQPLQEWDETEAKCSALLKIIDNVTK